MMFPKIEHPQLILADRLFDGVDGDAKTGHAVLVSGGRIQAVGDVEVVRNE